MKSKLSVVLFLTYVIIKTDSTTGTSLDDLIDLIQYGGIPLDPIYSINSTPMTYNDPLLFTAAAQSDRVLKTTGVALIQTATETSMNTTLTGGPLEQDVYDWYEVVMTFDSNPSNDPCSLPITIYLIMKNSKYTLDESAKKEDGVNILIIRGKVIGSFDNPLATNFVTQVQELRMKSEVVTDSSTAFKWYDIISNTSSYFFYPGTFENSDGTMYFATIIELSADTRPYLSNSQFDNLQSVANTDGKSSNTPTSLTETGPVIQATGVQEQISQSE